MPGFVRKLPNIHSVNDFTAMPGGFEIELHIVADARQAHHGFDNDKKENAS
jgi:hypothetical protein